MSACGAARRRCLQAAAVAVATLASGYLYLESWPRIHCLLGTGRDVHCQVPVSAYRLLCGGWIEAPSWRRHDVKLSPHRAPA